MSEEDCQAFVVKAVGLALARDGSSGGCIRTVVITKDGVRRSFLPNDKVCDALNRVLMNMNTEMNIATGCGTPGRKPYWGLPVQQSL